MNQMKELTYTKGQAFQNDCYFNRLHEQTKDLHQQYIGLHKCNHANNPVARPSLQFSLNTKCY